MSRLQQAGNEIILAENKDCDIYTSHAALEDLQSNYLHMYNKLCTHTHTLFAAGSICTLTDIERNLPTTCTYPTVHDMNTYLVTATIQRVKVLLKGVESKAKARKSRQKSLPAHMSSQNGCD